jgi:hypothetical protein
MFRAALAIRFILQSAVRAVEAEQAISYMSRLVTRFE